MFKSHSKSTKVLGVCVFLQMEVSRDSSYVLAYWKVENEGKEVFVETLLKENIDQIRLVFIFVVSIIIKPQRSVHIRKYCNLIGS